MEKERAILEVNEKISKSQIGKTLSLSEVNALTPLLSEIFPKLGNDEEGKVKAINALSSVIVNNLLEMPSTNFGFVSLQKRLLIKNFFLTLWSPWLLSPYQRL